MSNDKPKSPGGGGLDNRKTLLVMGKYLERERKKNIEYCIGYLKRVSFSSFFANNVRNLHTEPELLNETAGVM